jgi:hypothetical protein
MEDGRWIEDQDIGHIWDATRPDDPKNKRVSVVPLAPLARNILSKVPIIDARGGKDFVFTTTGVGPEQVQGAAGRQDAGASAAMVRKAQ